MKLGTKFLTAAAFVLSVGSASAATVTFDGALGGNPSGSYEEAGYSFTPNSGTNDVKCYDGTCLKEFRQGQITTMTKVGGGVFDLVGFYFALVGNGTQTQGVQDITVKGLFADLTTISRTFSLNALLSSFTDTTVVGADVPSATKILKNDGYFVTILNGLFNNVTQVQWLTNSTGVRSASARLDNVSANSPSAVPLPAAGFLLLGGLGGLAALRRKRQAV